MLAWTQQNTMQRAMWTVLEWPQSHAISKTINMLTNKSEPQQKCRLGTVSKILLGGLNRFYRRLTSPSASIMAQNIQLFGPRGGFLYFRNTFKAIIISEFLDPFIKKPF